MNGASTPAFAARTMLTLVALATVGFLSFLLLFAYADDLRPARNGGTHALSTSAVGFAGLADLVKHTGGEARMVRSEADLDDASFVILTPGPGTDPAAVKRILERRQGLSTLVILPKWVTAPLPNNPQWVRATSTIPEFMAALPISEVVQVAIKSPAGHGLRTISGTGLEPVSTDPHGATLVASHGDSLLTITADPDLFDNKGLATREGAERAMQILDELGATEDAVAFDLTLHGFGRNPNLLKLAFEAPFLPLTLCVLVAALLAGWHAMLRFGPAASPGRGLAFGKRALADNGAALLRLARRRHRTGERYGALVRETAALATGAPAGLSGDALDHYLDRLDPAGEPFSSMAARAADAPDTRRLLDAARDLYHWKRTVTREHR
ncbi:DUF4350 domain-containing protein [Sphingomonas psychrotolerans]|uniref:DUF4350 domain-containing protein n=1 Tax=Sphingomonas psychrotolerans TaxID=1327635 RepID=A0A2K8MDN5_9SPHN|nr:hypothetical protein [Sphingomonas psychrotolerans]ATY30666.1 hypothetical protein CVN68_00550 [Sphingomonas psychrotolerans]